ncbi:Protein of uncharacterised function%2C possible prophage protein [Mycobacteroides abscessus]|uniref:Protein of uncharacterized function, possible prophage protein n=1 Tax=Mycobacteroides abscessus subsp. massiliense TaxID=1962118 RepID=A0AB38DJM1_9MYCO|nr:type II toxin-antitoxin system antitoxin SocA domain-containing protein [Mycobacteroides abscessus]QSM01981.1 GepA-like toxin [Mycobacterium phage prophi68-1]QSM05026.1 GepA-like toxin [Mycobacterium phage prophiGD04-1]AMU25500.1 hypothetical protein A3N96_08820 [Mycobacteroides abscessus]AMU35226.1 hypothetical protein A3N98_08280 [Mycobacteroides abscessus]AMU40229.1 hypothetical protein A3N99_08610 [Mycobacteroides abscessus]
MATSLDAAAYILHATGGAEQSAFRAKSLQKLVYYGQAWSMVWDGKPLFLEPIEAWRDGPVVRRLYSAHYRQYSVSAIPGGNANALTGEEKAVLDSVLDFYGRLSCEELVDRTHREMPWQQARGDLPYGAHSSAEIDTATMRAFYTRRSVLGDPVPRRPRTQAVEAHDDDVTVEAQAQAKEWSETLEWLATR